MNLPNKLTLSRFVLTVGFLVVMFSGMPYRETIALALFVAAGISDFLDGQIARRRNLITNFGILMDPLADKIMVCSAFIAFVELGWFAAWMAVIVVARELAITGLRLLAASKNVVLAAEGYGKHKTISQIIAVIAIFISQIMEKISGAQSVRQFLDGTFSAITLGRGGSRKFSNGSPSRSRLFPAGCISGKIAALYLDADM